MEYPQRRLADVDGPTYLYTGYPSLPLQYGEQFDLQAPRVHNTSESIYPEPDCNRAMTALAPLSMHQQTPTRYEVFHSRNGYTADQIQTLSGTRDAYGRVVFPPRHVCSNTEFRWLPILASAVPRPDSLPTCTYSSRFPLHSSVRDGLAELWTCQYGADVNSFWQFLVKSQKRRQQCLGHRSQH
jgi:hypothetical protein